MPSATDLRVRSHTFVRVLQQLANVRALSRSDLARVQIRVPHSDVGSWIQIGFLHADVLQRRGRAVFEREIEQTRSGVLLPRVPPKAQADALEGRSTTQFSISELVLNTDLERACVLTERSQSRT
jgi:hypothetical protein